MTPTLMLALWSSRFLLHQVINGLYSFRPVFWLLFVLGSGFHMRTLFNWLYFYCSFDCRFPLRGRRIILYKNVHVHISEAICCRLIYCLDSLVGFPYEGGFFVLRCLSVFYYCICQSALYVVIMENHHGCTRIPFSWARTSEVSASM